MLCVQFKICHWNISSQFELHIHLSCSLLHSIYFFYCSGFHTTPLAAIGEFRTTQTALALRYPETSTPVSDLTKHFEWRGETLLKICLWKWFWVIEALFLLWKMGGEWMEMDGRSSRCSGLLLVLEWPDLWMFQPHNMFFFMFPLELRQVHCRDKERAIGWVKRNGSWVSSWWAQCRTQLWYSVGLVLSSKFNSL